MMRGRIQRHKNDNADVHVRTRAFDYARNILFEHKHLVVQGNPGEGKTYLALSLVEDLIEKDKDIQPVQIYNTNEWEELVDKKQPLVVFLDDVLGKYEVSETELDLWKKLSELIQPNLSCSSIFLIICIRTQILSAIKLSLQRNDAFSLLFNSNVVDISNEKYRLTKEERKQMLMNYAPNCMDRNDKVAIDNILKMKSVIGFPQNCKIYKCRQNVTTDLKDVFSNNVFLIEEILEISRRSPEIYTFLVLLMLSGGSLCLEKKMEEVNNKIKIISDYFELNKKLNSAQIKDIAQSLCGTLVEYSKEEKKFYFQHGCIETAVFFSFGKDYPDVTLRHCSLKQLSKMCCVANTTTCFNGEDFLNFKIMIDDDHFTVLCERFNGGLETGERESFKFISEALVWKSLRFVKYFTNKMTSANDVLNFLSKRDPDGQSLLTHLMYAKNTLVVERIIEKIAHCDIRDDNLVARQLLLATTNACLSKEKGILKNLIEFQEKVDNFVMLAAASTGNVSIMKMLVLRGGNINATMNIKYIQDLVDAIKNCVSSPKPSSYLYDLNIVHIACITGRRDMVKYLMTRYPDLVHKTSNVGTTAIHFAAMSGNVELIKVLNAEKVDYSDDSVQAKTLVELNITARTNDGINVLHIAANNNNLTLVKYLVKRYPRLTQQTNENGWTAAHYAASGGSVPVIETLIQAGLDITTITNDGVNVLHVAAINDILTVVKYLVKTYPRLTQQTDDVGSTAGHYAAAYSSVPVIETLIQAGLDITARDNDGANVLYIAARHGNLTIVKYLIKTHPRLIKLTDKNGWTAVHNAAKGGSIPVIETLIEAGLDITARTNNGAHVLHIAANSDNLAIVKYFIDTHPRLKKQTDKNGWTAVHHAAAGGSVPVIETLIQAGLDTAAKTKDDAHVLHIAANYDNLTIVKYLIETHPRLIQQTDKNGWTAVHHAAKGGSIPVIETLIEAELDITARTNDGAHVLHIAARYNNLTIVTCLIESHSILTQQTDKDGLTAVHYAPTSGSVPVIETLIQAGLDITARTNDGKHVLHIAAIQDNMSIVKYLIETHPRLIKLTDKNGWTAVHHAAARSSVPVIETLIEAGLDITARTNDGKHLLHIAAKNDNLTVVKYLIQTHPRLTQQNDENGLTALHHAAVGGSISVIETLIEAGLDITARTNDGAHLLHIAANYDNLTVVKYCIETHPRSIQQTDENGLTALHHAAAGGSIPVIETLIQAGLDITARTNDGAHILHIAANSDNLTVVKYCIETHPRLIQLTNKNGLTAVHYAAKGGSVTVIETLIQAGLDIRARTNDGSHVLHVAAIHDNLTIVIYLIETHTHLLQQTDKYGWTAIHSAAAGGSVPVIQILIHAGLDIITRTNDGSHVLHIAARHDNLTMVKYLIETKPKLKLQADSEGMTAIHSAAAGGSVPVIKILIHVGLDIIARTNDGSHVLHVAARHDNLTIVKYLIETKPRLKQQTDKEGMTAVHHAVARASVPMIETLMQAGLDITARTNGGRNILHIAAKNDNLTVVKYLIETHPRLTQQTDKYGLTAVHHAAAGGSVPVIETLIQAGLEITARTNDGAHVLHIAVRLDNLTIVKYLIETQRRLIQLTDKNGWTAIHHAAAGGSVPVIETLLQAGLDITARTNNGSHVLLIAVKNGNLSIVKYLNETHRKVLLQETVSL